MGYSHYWYRPPSLDAAKFRAVVADCKRICDALPVPLGHMDGHGEPEFAADVVCFNGSVHSESFARSDAVIAWPTDGAAGLATVGADVDGGTWHSGDLVTSRAVDTDGDGSYETFRVARNEALQDWRKAEGASDVFRCCKTAFRPYDLNVQCALIAFKHHFGAAFSVRSDGESEQWQDARSVCQEILGYGVLFELDADD